MYFFQPILPVLVERFEVRISYASLTMSLHTIGLIVGLILLGFFSDRRGRRIFILLSILFTALFSFLLPLLPYFSLIIMIRILHAFILAGVFSAALAYFWEYLGLRSFGFYCTLYIFCNSFGSITGGFVSVYLFA